MKKIVVIGGGFSGLSAIKQLINSNKLKITIINKNELFLFTPRLTELLNSSVNKEIVIKDIKKIYGNKINFVKDTAIYVDFNKRFVKIKKNNLKIYYDYLIMSQGATTNYFGNKNIQKNTLEFKDYESILELKAKLKINLEKYSNSNYNDFFTCTVIGAGLTGIELICSLREYILKELIKYPNIKQNKLKFFLIQRGDTIIPQFNSKVRSMIEKYLGDKNIKILTNTNVKDVKNNFIITNNKKIKSSIIMWTAGITTNKINSYPQIKLGKNNKIEVNSKLKIPMFQNVYVGGDTSFFVENNNLLPPTAQMAMQQGKNIGCNILKRIDGKKETDFHSFNKGTLAVLGRRHGLYNYKNFVYIGKLGWFFRNSVYKHLFRSITCKQK